VSKAEVDMTDRRLVAVGLLAAALGLGGSVLADTGSVRTLLVEAVRPGLEITVDRGCGATYVVGEALDVFVESELDGYLTLYDFTTDGLVHQIYPNEYYSDNSIEAGVEYKIPGNLLPFVFRVAPPEGEEILFGVVTSRPFSFLPDQYFDYSQAFPQVVLGDEETAGRLTESLGILPGDVRSAVAVCHFFVEEAVETKPEPEPEPEPRGEVYALFVAISDYIGDTDNDFGCPVMQNTIQLIRDTIGDFFDHTMQLDDADATCANILSTMRSFLGQAGADDTVYFHFAGHGLQVDDENGDEDDGKDEAIAPYDAKLILDDEIWEVVSSLDAGRAILIFESCHSGTAERGLVSSMLYSVPSTRGTGMMASTMLDDLDASTRRVGGPAILALQACGAAESSWSWCGRDGDSGLTFFAEGLSHAFSEASEDADTDSDSWVSFQEAFALAKNHVKNVIEEAVAAGDLEAGTVQTPVMQDSVGQPVNAVRVE
jgi:hypothetical protein